MVYLCNGSLPYFYFFQPKGGDSMKKNPIDTIAWILVIIGGLNWGLVGIANLDIVDLIFGTIPVLAKIVYILVGISALYVLLTMKKCCSDKPGAPKMS